MGAGDTMEIFFERLNAGDREGAVELMDERAEMRVHVRDSSRTLRGVSQVGGWFLRADEGLRMVPGDGPRDGQHVRGGPPGPASRRTVAAPRRDVPRRGRAHHEHQPLAEVAALLARRSRPANRGTRRYPSEAAGSVASGDACGRGGGVARRQPGAHA